MAGEAQLFKRAAADAVLIGVTFVWGVTFVVVQNAIRYMPVFPFLALRFGGAAIVLLILAFALPSSRNALRDTQIWRAGLWLGFWLFAGYALQTLGLLYTSPANSGLITGLCVVIVPLFAWWFERTRTGWPVLLGVGMATAGLILLSAGQAQGPGPGDVLTLGCAVCFAVQILWMGRMAPLFPALPLTAAEISMVSALAGAMSLLGRSDWPVAISALHQPSVQAALAVCTLLATLLAYAAQTAFQRFTTAAHTALIFSAEPVFAALTAWWLAGDRLGAAGIAGGSLIVGGMLASEWKPAGRTAG